MNVNGNERFKNQEKKYEHWYFMFIWYTYLYWAHRTMLECVSVTLLVLKLAPDVKPQKT